MGVEYREGVVPFPFSYKKVWFKRNEFALKLLLWCYHIYKILYKQSDYWRFLLSEYSYFYPFIVINLITNKGKESYTFPFFLYFIIIIFKMLPWRPLFRQRPSCRLCWLSLYYRAASAPVRCLCATSETGTPWVAWVTFPIFLSKSSRDTHITSRRATSHYHTISTRYTHTSYI